MIAGLSAHRALARPVLALLIALAPVAIAKAAPSAAQTQQPSAQAVALAKQIIILKGAKKTIFDPLVRGVVEKVKDQYLQADFIWEKDLNEIAANLKKQYAPEANQLVDIAARLYASRFTVPELKQILAFYQSPLGQKVIQLEPQVLDQAMVQAGQWSARFAQVVTAKFRKEMKKRGHGL